MTSGTEGWLEKLVDKKIPVLKLRREQMLEILEDEDRSLSDCQPILLSDPLMTASLFKDMNLQRVKDNRLQVTTVSSLLSLMGVPRLIEAVRAMPAIEEMGLPAASIRGIEKCLKQSWYCTWFAMKWVTDREVKEPEEVHVAAILQSVPELMLWCYGGDAMLKINHYAYYECGVYYEEVAKVLGCNKREIGVKLAEKWALPELACFGFETKFNAFTHATAIGLAAVLARICQHGWYGADLDFFREKASHYFGEAESKASSRLHQQLLELADDELAMDYRPVACMLIYTDDKKYPEKEFCLASLLKQAEPVKQTKTKPEAVQEQPETGQVTAARKEKQIDQQKLASEVKQIKQLVQQKAGLNDLVKQTLLTLHNTLCFQRVCFLLLAPDRSKLVSKVNLFSEPADDSLKKLAIDVKEKNLFSHLMGKPQSFRLSNENFEKIWVAVPGTVKSLTHSERFCCASVYSMGKPLGLIYVDDGGKEISGDVFKLFQQLVMMLNKGLELLSKK